MRIRSSSFLVMYSKKPYNRLNMLAGLLLYKMGAILSSKPTRGHMQYASASSKLREALTAFRCGLQIQVLLQASLERDSERQCNLLQLGSKKLLSGDTLCIIHSVRAQPSLDFSTLDQKERFGWGDVTFPSFL